MRERSGLESLHTRRERTVEAFAKKNLLSQQFGGWFQERQQSRYERRRKNGYRYTEPTARTDRFRNFPLNYMRRKLNSNWNLVGGGGKAHALLKLIKLTTQCVMILLFWSSDFYQILLLIWSPKCLNDIPRFVNFIVIAATSLSLLYECEELLKVCV